jgi:hypothetical protein
MSRRGARRPRAERGPGLFALLLVAAVAWAGQARADGDAATQARAKDAYDRGSVAYRARDYGRAAVEFAAADALAPNPVTLRAALDAATLADDAILGTELLERARRITEGAPESDLAGIIATARARFAHRTGRIVVRCSGDAPCLATVDGAAVEPSHPRVVAPGVHTVTLQTTGPAEPRLVDVPADQTVEVATGASTPPPLPLPPAPAPAPAKPPAATGLSPAWFASAAVVTGVALGFTIWSGVNATNEHSQFVDAGCLARNASQCSALQTSGVAEQTRTNVFIATTAGIAAATLAIGIFATRWHGPAAVSVGVEPRGASLALRSTF